MEKKIGKVTLDFSAYTGKDRYSDGDIELEILAALKEGRAEKMLAEDHRWPVLYHPAPERENLLAWLPLKRSDRVLEIGAGCGAVTGALLRGAGEVHSVEISPVRAEMAATRHQACDNLTVHVGNLNDMTELGTFDYVTLIGVLEYAASFTHTAHPYRDFLESCRKFLKPSGTLVIAIENRLGLKYFSGAAEDHSGRLFDGVIGYPSTDWVRTFSRRELAELTESAGLPGQLWYYPWPDYKLPHDIFSDRGLPSEREIDEGSNHVYDGERLELFNEKQAVKGILSAGLFHEMSNSFLLLARQQAFSEEDTAALPVKVHVAERRKAHCRIATEIFRAPHPVYKRALSPAARPHLQRMLENEAKLVCQYGRRHVAHSWRVDDDTIATEYVEGERFDLLMERAFQEQGAEGVSGFLEFYCREILRGGSVQGVETPDVFAPSRCYDLDLNFDNIVIRDGDFVILDYEWLARNVTAQFILWRALCDFTTDMSRTMRQALPDEAFMRAVGMTHEKAAQYLEIEKLFEDEHMCWRGKNYVKARHRLLLPKEEK